MADSERIAALLRRSQILREDGEFAEAESFLDKALELDPECGEAYAGIFLIRQKCADWEAFQARYSQRLQALTPRRETPSLSEGGDPAQLAADRYAVGELTRERILTMFRYDAGFDSLYHPIAELLQETRTFFDTNKDWSRALRFSDPAQASALQARRDRILREMEQATQAAEERYRRDLAVAEQMSRAHLALAEAQVQKAHGEALAKEREKQEAEYLEYAALRQLLREPSRRVAADMAGKVLSADTGKCITVYQDGSAALHEHREPLVAAGCWGESSILIRKDGSVFLRYQNQEESDQVRFWLGKTADLWKDIVAVSLGREHIAALTTKGVVRTYGATKSNEAYGQLNISGWTGKFQQVAAGAYHTVGLRTDGTVMSTGTMAGEVAQWKDIVAVAAGNRCTFGLTKSGQVVWAGEVLQDMKDTLRRWHGLVAISASHGEVTHLMGLRADGKVVADGGFLGQCDVETWENVAAIAAGQGFSLGLQYDGTILFAGGYNRLLGGYKDNKTELRPLAQEQTGWEIREAAQRRYHQECVRRRTDREEQWYCDGLKVMQEERDKVQAQLDRLRGFFTKKRREELQESLDRWDGRIARRAADILDMQG